MILEGIMSAYTKTPWQNNKFPEISAENLLKLEQGSFQALGVDNLNRLRKILTPPAVLRCVVRGTSSVNDGGGGNYDWDESSNDADNDSTVIEPNDSTGAGRWILNDNSDVGRRFLNDPENFTYDFSKVSDVNDISSNYTTINILTTPYRNSGVYELKLSLTFTFDEISKSDYFRWRQDDGDWNTSISEPSDKTDETMNAYFYPVVWTGGPTTIEVQMKKETTNSGTLDVQFMDIIWQRVA
jgi:hypothetical protein